MNQSRADVQVGQAHEAEHGCFLNQDGIRQRLRESYGLTADANPGPRASELLGLKTKW